MTEPLSATATSDTKLQRIVVCHMDGARRDDIEFYFGQTVTVGRAFDCDLHFPNEKSTSPHHAVLRQRAGDVELLDTQSTNGTYVNDVRVERAILKAGDVLQFGVLGPRVNVSFEEIPVAPVVANAPAAATEVQAAVAISPLVDQTVPAWRFARNAAMLYVGGSVAAVGVADAVFDRYNLNARWFSAFLIFLVGGLVSTVVEAWYRGAPGKQKFALWEGAVHLIVLVLCVLGAWLAVR